MRLSLITGLLVALIVPAVPAQAQDQQGPMVPPPKFEVHRISSVPHPGPPPIPAQEIIQRFAANEDVMEKVYKTYTFTQTIRIEEMGDPGGKFTATGQVYTKPDGDQFWRITQPLQSDLKTTTVRMEDVRSIETIPLFVLTGEEIGNYNFLYAGQDKLDELNTYVFQVKPKQLSRTRRYFDGVIWVDDHDFAIVKSYGKFVSEVEGNGLPLPFTMFETYRENFQEKYWLPTYTNSDDFITTKAGDQVHLRLVIHSQDFKLIPQTNTAAPAGAGEKPGSPGNN
ncbi:MAG TPA: hypothetical protein VMH00_06390 [Candidatus Limnocylindrales bacterium]|nr:hypothetical protein [Candidatus Limnocylindrales bacterium]